MIYSLEFDTSGLSGQAKELAGLLEVLEDVPPDIRRGIKEMFSDVVLGDLSIAFGADGTHKLIQGLRVGRTLERLRAALLARKRDSLSHV
jgi:hypothetical protein